MVCQRHKSDLDSCCLKAVNTRLGGKKPNAITWFILFLILWHLLNYVALLSPCPYCPALVCSSLLSVCLILCTHSSFCLEYAPPLAFPPFPQTSASDSPNHRLLWDVFSASESWLGDPSVFPVAPVLALFCGSSNPSLPTLIPKNLYILKALLLYLLLFVFGN